MKFCKSQLEMMALERHLALSTIGMIVNRFHITTPELRKAERENDQLDYWVRENL